MPLSGKFPKKCRISEQSTQAYYIERQALRKKFYQPTGKQP